MTSRQRFFATLQRRPVDRLFRYEHGPWPTTRNRWVAEGLPNDADFNRYFGMDPLVRICINSGYCDSPYHPRFHRRTIEETPTMRLYVDGDGVTKREIAPWDTSMPEFIRFPVTDRSDWAQVRKRLDPADAPARIGDAAALAARCADLNTPTMLPICGAFGHPRNLLGDEGLAYAIFDDPALVEEILDNWRDLYVELLRDLTAKVRVDAILIWEDMCYKCGPLISPEHFRRFMLPRYVDVVQAARRGGVQGVLVDTDGDCLKMIPIFLEAGADCLMPFEVQAGMDVVKIARDFPTLCIMGGIDKRPLAGSRQDIRAEVDRVVPPLLARGGFFPALDHTVPPNVPLDSFRYYLDCLRQYE